jgi:hypothetical protein
MRCKNVKSTRPCWGTPVLESPSENAKGRLFIIADGLLREWDGFLGHSGRLPKAVYVGVVGGWIISVAVKQKEHFSLDGNNI